MPPPHVQNWVKTQTSLQLLGLKIQYIIDYYYNTNKLPVKFCEELL